MSVRPVDDLRGCRGCRGDCDECEVFRVSRSVIRVRPSVIRASVKIASYVADASRGCANETKKPSN